MVSVGIDMFDIDPRMVKLLGSEFSESGYKLLESAEKYKLVSREVIINKLISLGTLVENISDIPDKNIPLGLENIVEGLESEYNIIIVFDSAKSCEVYAHPFSNVRVEILCVKLGVISVDIHIVTPTNLNELRDNHGRSRWDIKLLFHRIVIDAMERNATDVHVTAHYVESEYVYPLQYRVSGEIEDCNLFHIDQVTNKELIHYIVNDLTMRPVGDLDTYKGITGGVLDVFKDGKVSLRVSAMTVMGGYKCVFRIQTSQTVGMSLDDLGFGEEIANDLRKIVKKKSGLTPVTGGMNTGKNTTVFSIANEMSKYPIVIADYSSPPEFSVPYTQVDYGDDIRKLNSAITLTKKQNVDVVTVNETPNTEVALSIRDLVNSNVHVLTTFHIDRVWHLPHKLFEFYGNDFKNIWSQLNGCFNQKMYVRCCSHCMREMAVSGIPNKDYRDLLTKYGVVFYKRSEGCSQCDHKGKTKYLKPLMERFLMTESLYSDLMKVDRPYEMESILRDYVKSNGFELEKYLCKEIESGVVSLESLDSIL